MEKIIKQALKKSKKELLKTGAVEMKFFMTEETGEKHRIVFPDVPDNHAGRNVMAHFIRDVVKFFKMKEVLLVADCYNHDDEYEPEADETYDKVELDPNKRDCILILYEDIDQNNYVVQQFYHRDDKGKIRFDELKKVPGGADKGRFAGFFANLN